MAACAANDAPGYGNEASGATARLERRVQYCGPRTNKNAVTGIGAGCCASRPPIGLAAVQQSAYLKAKMEECPEFQGPPPAKNGTDYVAQLQSRTLACSGDPTDPSQRFAQYYKFIPAGCPPIPAEQLNSTLPKPSFNGQCQPSRFF